MGTLNPGQRIGPFEIASLLGRGGMGEVFLAKDTRLNRYVAIKVLPGEFVLDRQRLSRFEQEAKTLASLNHPNILSIFDTGVHEGTPYLVSELLEGKTLREVLRDGPLSQRKAIDIALQITHGLEAAHAKGIIHRDLKPENVFLTKDRRVKVLDFGLAKLKERDQRLEERGQNDGNSGAVTLVQTTQPGMVLGTIGYMSPEQVRGEEADHRSDIFSFGCVLYEMLSGRRAFKGGCSVEIMSAILNAEPEELALSTNPVPLAFDRVVRRCLEKDPGLRFQSASDLNFALQAAGENTPGIRMQPRAAAAPNAGVRKHLRGALAVGALLLLALNFAWLIRFGLHSSWQASSVEIQPAHVQPVSVQQSVAVLPFANLSPDSADEYFSDGLTEELINVLSNAKGLRVPGRSSCFAFKGRTGEDLVRQVGEQLRVNAVLEGTVQKVGDRIRIRASLVNVADGFNLWSARYDRHIEDIFEIQDEIARAIVTALKITLLGEEQDALFKRYTSNAEAYDLLLKARFSWTKFTEESLRKAIVLLEQVIAMDPNYAPAHVELGMCYGMLGFFGYIPPAESQARLRTSASKALQIDSKLPEAQWAFAGAEHSGWNWTSAERHYKRSLELNPNRAMPHLWYSWLLIETGREAEGLDHAVRALELEPLSPFVNAIVGECYFFARRFDDAIGRMRVAIELDPDFALAHWKLSWGLSEQGLHAEAIAAAKKAVALSGGDPVHRAGLARAYARGGFSAEARSLLHELEEQSSVRAISACDIALIHAALGQVNEAFQWLEQAVEQRDGWCLVLKVDARFDPLRSDPRFHSFLKRIGLDK